MNRVIPIVVILAGLTTEALGAVVTFDFDGVVTGHGSTGWQSGVAVGDSFSGWFSYDTATPESGDGLVLTYYYPTADFPIGLQVFLNGNTFTTRERLKYTETTFNAIPRVNLDISAEGIDSRDPLSPPVSRIDLLLLDAQGVARFGFSDPFGATLSFSDLSPFEEASISISGVTGNLTSLRLRVGAQSAVVPEPASVALWGGITAIVLTVRRRGRKVR